MIGVDKYSLRVLLMYAYHLGSEGFTYRNSCSNNLQLIHAVNYDLTSYI
jgi:hypothetical protein